MICFIDDTLRFPPVNLANEHGLLCVGGNLDPERLLLAYRSGIFPWSDEPCMWFSPDPRSVIDIQNYKPSKSLKRILKSVNFEIRFDHDFHSVIEHCAQTRHETWISDEFVESYTELHRRGYAHSVEVYYDDQLVGGLYGLSLGSAFMGESMFHLMSNASKVAFSALVYQLRHWGFTLLDCQIENEHLNSLGAENIPREAYILQLQKALEKETKKGPWLYDSKSLFCEGKCV